MSSSSALFPGIACIVLVATGNATTIIRTAEMDLNFVQRMYVQGTNLVDRGMFREADWMFAQAIKLANNRLQEYDQRAATAVPLQGFVHQLQEIRDHFEEDWTNAVQKALVLQEPIQSFVESNKVIQIGLEWPMNRFEWLQAEFASDNKRDADTTLRLIQDSLNRQISAYEQSRKCEEGFRSAITNVERARDDLEVARTKPLDAERALRIAWDYYAATTNRIAGPNGAFVGAEDTRQAAREYLDDIRRAGVLENEVEALSAALDATVRTANIAGVRYYIGEARRQLQNNRPDSAKMDLDVADRLYLSKLKGDSTFYGLLNEWKELKRVAEQRIAEQARARDEAEIAKLREEIGDPNAPVLSRAILVPVNNNEESLRLFSQETDFAAILIREVTGEGLDPAVDRVGSNQLLGFVADPEMWKAMRQAFLQTQNTNYPAVFPGGEHFHFEFLHRPRTGNFYARIRTGENGQTIREIVPWIRTLDVIRTSAHPDDAYLYFAGDANALFVPGGRTALIPGLGALLEKKHPKTWFNKDIPPISFHTW